MRNGVGAAALALAWIPAGHTQGQERPRVELDHIFVVVTPGEPRAFGVLRPALLEMAAGPAPRLELYLEGGGRRTDLRPVLPVVIVR